MNNTIDAFFSRGRVVLLGFAFILFSGMMAYQSIPKESEPDIVVPLIYVSLVHDGISPEDAERLLIRPMEKELQSIEGLKEMKSTANEGHASVQLEFSAGFDSKQALTDVREKVDMAKAKLPAASEEPEVIEVNVALFPVLTVSLSGAIPERSLVEIARKLKDNIEALPGVLEVDIGGDREALLEVIVDPAVMETYDIQYADVINHITSNNMLVAAGAMDTGAGRLVLKVPGIIEDLNDMLKMPIKVASNRVVTFDEVAKIRRGFKDSESFARVDGQPAVTLEVKKRVGANIIETVAQVREIVREQSQTWPSGIEIGFMQDKSNDITTMLGDLQNNILSAIILVMIVIIAALGPRSSVLVGMSIPGAFLATILVLDYMGFTLNIVVLFSLILVVGMLVDGAIVVIELADRNISNGAEPKQAFAAASKRMAWPVTASTITTLAVFMPLLFWPGMVGEFMKFLPMTVIIALTASLAMALIFIPVLGSSVTPRDLKVEQANLDGIWSTRYGNVLKVLLQNPGKTLFATVLSIFVSYSSYAVLGKGVEFFPDVEPEMAQIQVRARGDLSIYEKDAIVRKVEEKVMGMAELESVYGRSFNSADGQNMARDVIGVIQLEFVDWDKRRPANEILEEMRQKTSDIAGIKLEFRKAENGPSDGKPIQLEFNALQYERVAPVVAKVRQIMEQQGNYVDVEDNRPLPGIEWRVNVDREKAALYGANIGIIGNAVQMITNGIKVSDYRPDDTDDEVDIRVRFPFDERNLGQLDQLKVSTQRGMVPISNFVSIEPAPKSGVLTRIDTKRVITIQADVAEGVLPANQLLELQKILAETQLDPAVDINFKGESEDQEEAMSFLSGAFITAIFLMLMVLVAQFNSIYQALLVLSAIVFSTAGVLIGLMITAQPFGIVMVGLGIIALAGIVVNNNIVLIDTFNQFRKEGLSVFEAAYEAGKIRMRPVLLTAFTTVLGLMPMVMAMNIDLVNRSISFGAPSTQWWTQLASAIAGGLSFATVLTLFLTPCLLVLGDQFGSFIRDKFSATVGMFKKLQAN
ncbi:MAG: efflux RND transporter permease subunit [Kangiellaceae bacterium]|jgi:multidrug efflux pump|nr:efflux RND transporter permease subunit [Kangiellaceae bacterium]